MVGDVVVVEVRQRQPPGAGIADLVVDRFPIGVEGIAYAITVAGIAHVGLLPGEPMRQILVGAGLERGDPPAGTPNGRSGDE